MYNSKLKTQNSKFKTLNSSFFPLTSHLSPLTSHLLPITYYISYKSPADSGAQGAAASISTNTFSISGR